jgi:hypothetical protein
VNHESKFLSTALQRLFKSNVLFGRKRRISRLSTFVEMGICPFDKGRSTEKLMTAATEQIARLAQIFH